MIVQVSVALLGSLIIIILMGIAVKRKKRINRLKKVLSGTTFQLENIQQAFHRFAPQQVVEDIINQGISIQGEKKEVTVLFADLVGFTKMSEHLAPEAVVKILNGYFQAMSHAITNHRGHLSKFIGDGIMALFGAPEPNPWQAMDAVNAALEMRTELATYNVELQKNGQQPLGIGIGIHRGTVVAGVVGSNVLMDYTVIGDVVNTASRIEGLTRKEKVDILISASVQEALDQRYILKELNPVEVKGRSEKVVTFAVEGNQVENN